MENGEHQEPPSPSEDNTARQRQTLLLDLIDCLKQEGFGADFDLPQMIVCGDQSSGKSSLLEAISRIKFPVNDTLCTRFPLELILRDSAESTFRISIIPSTGRCDEEQHNLRSFKSKYKSLNHILAIIQEAQSVMGINDGTTTFADDVLRIECHGRNLPDLSLVDLPGFFHGMAPGQSSQDVTRVKTMVEGYMKRPRTIILAVLSAKNDLAQQVVTKLAKDIDPGGQRTVGVITKPDALDDSPNQAKQYIAIVKGQHLNFSCLAWHVLRTKKVSEQQMTWEQFGSRVETPLFDSQLWAAVPPSQKGIASFRIVLQKILYNHIVECAHPLANEIQAKVSEHEAQLHEMSSTIGAVRDDLVQKAHCFADIVKGSSTGHYSDDFFRQYSTTVELYTMANDRIAQFVAIMRGQGHHWNIVNNHESETIDHTNGDVINIDRADFDKIIIDSLERARSMPGQLDSRVLLELFDKQAQQWPSLVDELVTNITDDARAVVLTALEYVTDASVGKLLYNRVIHPKLQKLFDDCRGEIKKILFPSRSLRTITLPKYIYDEIEAARQDEIGLILERQLNNVFKSVASTSSTKNRSNKATIQDIVGEIKADITIERIACAEIVRCLDKYYGRQLQKLIDAVEVNVFHDHLFSKLPSLFDFAAIKSFSDDDLKSFDPKHAQDKLQHQQLQEKIDLLRMYLLRFRDAKKLSTTSTSPSTSSAVAVKRQTPADQTKTATKKARLS